MHHQGPERFKNGKKGQDLCKTDKIHFMGSGAGAWEGMEHVEFDKDWVRWAFGNRTSCTLSISSLPQHVNHQRQMALRNNSEAQRSVWTWKGNSHRKHYCGLSQVAAMLFSRFAATALRRDWVGSARQTCNYRDSLKSPQVCTTGYLCTKLGHKDWILSLGAMQARPRSLDLNENTRK